MKMLLRMVEKTMIYGYSIKMAEDAIQEAPMPQKLTGMTRCKK